MDIFLQLKVSKKMEYIETKKVKLYNENMILHPDDLEILMGLKEGTLVDKKDVKVLSFNNKKRK